MEVNLQEESCHLELGDKRREKRFVKIVEQLVNNPQRNICDRCYSWPDIKGTYRFLSNNNIKESALMDGISQATRERSLQKELILCLQDTTNIAFDSSADGLGYLDHGMGTGVMAHNILAVDDQGCPVGILHQNIWERDLSQRGKAKNRKERDITEKESNRWPQGLMACEKILSDCKKMVTVADREADIYELFAMPRAANSELLIRAVHDRKTLLGNTIWEEVAQQRIIGSFNAEIGNSHTGEITTVKMQIRTGMVLLAPPKTRPHLQAIIVNGLLVRQEDATEQKGLEWRLISSMPIENEQMAKQLVKWYSYRWRIERFHYILKSGCKLEQLQLRTLPALRKAVITYSLAAFKLMEMLYQSRINPQQPATNYLSEQECQAVYIYNYQTKLVSNTSLTLSKAIWMIARMGGYIGRNNDRPPGIKTLWRGLQNLHSIMQVYQVSQPTYPHFGFG